MKTIIIGQAPPYNKQEKPYDSTVLYEWLDHFNVNYSNIEFGAVFNKFPGFNKSGGHKIPTKKQMNEYWPILIEKINLSNNIILLGSVSKNFVLNKFNINPKKHDWGSILFYENKTIGIIPHPSKRNFLLHKQKQKEIRNVFKEIFNK